MRKSLLMSAALLSLASGAAFAQNTVGSAQTPPSPGAGSQTPQPTNSVPPGASNVAIPTPGANLGATAAAPPAVVAVPYGSVPAARVALPPRKGIRAVRTPDEAYAEQAAPPTGAYRGGAGSPASTQASNTTAANTRSEIAPRLPNPDAAANTPEAFLAAAQRALGQNRTGAAQEALERAETRVLSRTTDPSMAGTPDDAAMVRHIGEARRALGNRNIPAARAAVAAAMASPVPPQGPTVTTTYDANPGVAVLGVPGYVSPLPLAPAPIYPPAAYPLAPNPMPPAGVTPAYPSGYVPPRGY